MQAKKRMSFWQTVSHSTTEIVARLDSGSKLAEKLGTLGLILTGLSFIVTPLSLLTSYYGMNVSEFVDGANLTLFGFWQIALPMATLSLGGLVLISVRFVLGNS